MGHNDRSALPGTPVTGIISRTRPNRLGAVCSSLWSFWTAQQNALAGAARADAYTVIVFNDSAQIVLENDSTRSPDDLLSFVMEYRTRGGTNYEAALLLAKDAMTRHWNPERCVQRFDS